MNEFLNTGATWTPRRTTWDGQGEGMKITWPSGAQMWGDVPVYPNAMTTTTGRKANVNAITTAVQAVGGYRPQIKSSLGEVLWEGAVVRKHDKALRAAEKHLHGKLEELLNA